MWIMISLDVLIIPPPKVLMISLQYTEHPPMYSRYSPMYLWYPPRYTKDPPCTKHIIQGVSAGLGSLACETIFHKCMPLVHNEPLIQHNYAARAVTVSATDRIQLLKLFTRRFQNEGRKFKSFNDFQILTKIAYLDLGRNFENQRILQTWLSNSFKTCGFTWFILSILFWLHFST